VHIADVSHYVTEKSRLDNVAFKRGTSIYPVDRVVPMLPKALSNHICSLHPHVDRLTLSVLMTVTVDGERLSYSIHPSVIRSVARLTYDQVQRVIDGDEKERAAHPDLTPCIDRLHILAQTLRQKRFSRGGLDFDLPEPKIILDSNGHVLSVEKTTIGTANQLIEEWMLMANQTVAYHLRKNDLPAVYRVHESPDPAKLSSAEAVFLALGYPKLRSASSKDLATLLRKTAGTPEEATIHTLLLRSMAKARYSEQPLGHYGLDMEDYCHFTSPIRRYPDLVVHRILKESLRGKLSAERLRTLKDFTVVAAEQASNTELIAVEAERECVRIKLAEYMSHRLGQEFDGVICGINNQGFFVQLPNTIEGMVRFSDLYDYYHFDETRFCAVGQRSGRVLRLGDTVTVTVLSADSETGRIDFGMY
ncbi:MAG: VacB/RNase II family 3'-5' exoribonuclease, partial [Clostridia bacterium]|nr:VacB/RNase II family 3'-5' exoribonuclease [Clostridia bacterium]